jgi:hypothetical protein
MAELARGPDYLKLHANVANRVRNLETGVHPTGSGLSYYDTIPPTTFSIRGGSSWHAHTVFPNDFPPRWQRRTGIVMLSGAVELDSGAGTVPAEDQIATLPAEARPLLSLVMQVSADSPPYRARIRITPGGDLFVLGDELDVAGAVVRLDGATWTVN